jgi:ribosomal protein S12 methylthiotransferase
MQRRVNREQTVELVGKLRERIPNLVLRTTFIVGFPGETDEQFQELCDFVEETRFERMGVFTFSPEPGTPAMKLDGHLPDDVKNARREELMSLQQQIAFDFGDSLIGYELDCLVDEQVDDNTWAGRLYTDAPEIDSQIFLQGEGIAIGDMVPVEIVGRDEYDLIGTPSEG